MGIIQVTGYIEFQVIGDSSWTSCHNWKILRYIHDHYYATFFKENLDFDTRHAKKTIQWKNDRAGQPTVIRCNDGIFSFRGDTDIIASINEFLDAYKITYVYGVKSPVLRCLIEEFHCWLQGSSDPIANDILVEKLIMRRQPWSPCSREQIMDCAKQLCAEGYERMAKF